MSDEKIDLADLEELATWPFPMAEGDAVLALVRAVRAARAYWYDGPLRLVEQQEAELDAALAPFTDSAESTSGVRDE